jgi:hypothetical protein
MADVLEMLHHAMKGAGGGDDNMTLRAEDDTSAGDNLAFLRSKLVWDKGEDGKERVLDADGNGYVIEQFNIGCGLNMQSHDGLGGTTQ